MSGTELAIVLVALLIGGCLQGTIGFGLGVVCVPVLAMVDPSLVPGPMLLVGISLMMIMAFRDRVEMDLRGAGWALVGRLVGTIVGAWLVLVLSPSAFALMLAVVVFCGAAAASRGWAPRPTRPALIIAGVTSGTMGTATAIGGPPMALVWGSSSGPKMRATMSAFFLVGTIMSVVSLIVVGEITLGTARVASILLPASLVGYLASLWLAKHVDREGLRRITIAVSVIGASALAIQQFL